MTTRVFDSEKIYKESSIIISKCINRVIQANKQAIIGLAGGKSISNTLDELIKMTIDWNHVHIFVVDERLVPIDNLLSNFKMIQEKFLQIMPKTNIHPFILNGDKKDYGLTKYNKLFKKYKKYFDIVIVSSGEDGHIGSLFPSHSSILNESDGYITVHNSPKPPTKRVTISKKMIIKSKTGFLFIVGDHKKNAYKKFFDNEINYIDCPSKLISKIPENYVIVSKELSED